MNQKKYEWGEGVYTLLSWFKKDRVRNARVLVAGAGALGNEVVKSLTLFGVGHIFIVDFDQIELSNLTRSVLFREEDAYAHAFKADVVAKRAMEINPQVQVTPIVGNLFSEVGLGLYRAVDVIIGCLDSRIARYQLNRLAIRADKSWIDGSIENLTGVVQVFTPEVNCYECGLSKEEFNQIMLRTGCADVVRTQTSTGRIATTPVSASIVGAVQVQEAMKLIHMKDEANSPFKTLSGKLWSYEGLTTSTHIFKHAVWKEECPAHIRWEPVVSCPDLSANDSIEDAIEKIAKLLYVNYVEVNMQNNKFISRIISDHPEKEFDLKIPESRLEGYIQENEELRKLSYKTLFRKDFIENIDENFPYPKMRLVDIGIPYYDILHVTTEKGLFYVELTADASKYNL